MEIRRMYRDDCFTVILHDFNIYVAEKKVNMRTRVANILECPYNHVSRFLRPLLWNFSRLYISQTLTTLYIYIYIYI